MQNQAAAIKDFIVKNLTDHDIDIVNLVVSHFNVTHTTVHRHINALVKEGKLVKSGNTRNTRYYLQGRYERMKSYKLTNTFHEDQVFYKDFADIFESLKYNVYKICSFGVTEMLNNAIDHSQGTNVTLSTKFNNPFLTIEIKDNGIGAFRKICDYLKIEDLREGILHISKGKITTDPANHSGQGIFFTSRMFDEFSISANGYKYTKYNIIHDWTFASTDNKNGTEIQMIMNIETCTNIAHIFSAYQDHDFAFDSTEIIVQLAKYNEESLVSRSQAKRILLGLEQFATINLDFKRINFVGQGFVDEIFRVFSNAHPHIKIKYNNANQDVEFMIERGK